jgi:hypothetical protein
MSRFLLSLLEPVWDSLWKWIKPRRPTFLWTRTFFAPCDSLTEWFGIQVKAGTNDRLQIVSAPLAKSAHALRVEVQDGDVAVNANNQPIPSGWRAEVIGPTELGSSDVVRYTWSTMLDTTYLDNPLSTDPNDPQVNRPIWQVITQWHQGDNNQGASPPVAFIIVGNEIQLDLNKHDPNDPGSSIQAGQWPVANLDRGQWHDFQVDVQWDLADGKIQVWHNGSPVTFNVGGQTLTQLTGLETLFPPLHNSTDLPTVYLKMGLYRKGVTTNATTPFVLYHDEVSRYQ